STPGVLETLVKFTVTVQLCCGCKVTPVQLSVSFRKNHVSGPDPVPEFTTTPLMVVVRPEATDEVFMRVTTPLPVPKLPIGVATVILNGFGEMDPAAPPPPPPPAPAANSTAPASTLLLPFRSRPKKSNGGARL